MTNENWDWATKEATISKEWGLTRPKLKELRGEAQENIHWVKKEDEGTKKGAIMWTDEGVEWLEAKVGSLVGSDLGTDVFGKLVVKPANKKLLLCEVRGVNEKVLVRNQDNFKIGMFVPLRKISDGSYIAAKYPSRNGKFIG